MATKDKAQAVSGGRISPKQKRFIQEYLVDLNATQAAIRAGYSERSAKQHADVMLSRPHIAAAVAKAQEKRAERTEITQDMVLRELAKIGFSDIRKVVRWGNTTVRKEVDDEGNEIEVPYHGIALVDSSEIDDDTAAAIAEVSQGKEGLKVKLYDKARTLVDIGKHIGMFKEKVQIEGHLTTTQVPDLSNMSDEQLEKLEFIARTMAGAAKPDTG